MIRLPSAIRWLPVLGILAIVGALLLTGILFVHSASAGPDDPFPSPLAKNHAIRVLIGIGLFSIVAFTDYRLFDRWAPILFGASLFLLLIILGMKVAQGGGVVRWFRIGGFSLQPSEFAKLGTVIILARLLKQGHMSVREKPWFACFIAAAVPFLMIAAQPDLGTALVIAPITLSILWVAGISIRFLASLGIAALALMVFGYEHLHDYQKTRLLVFLGRAGDNAASGDGYHITHSKISIGSGGPTGKGYGLGTHQDLGFLPEDHNDFIFGVIGEEMGLIGTLGLIFLFVCLFALCLRIAWTTREPFGRLAVIGITAQLAFQTVVNLSMTVGLAPVTGLPLPFVSYGGTSMFVVMMGIGFIVSVGLRRVESLHPDGLRAGSAQREFRAIRIRSRERVGY